MDRNTNEKLEVPSKESQSLRKEALVEKLLNSEKPTITSTSPSSILKQVKSFMPMMKTANDLLETVDQSSIQIDAEPKDDEPYVEMSVQLYEDNSGTSDSDSDSTNSTLSPDSSSEEDDDDDDELPAKQQKLISEIDVCDDEK
ncbi:unnamed protein product [Allacma fusca]|uniref:Uncharacterized protein n=1 Tax=Allacma fusca TaxID=39272 RepID=A0A8J2Q3B5_9HEXA|nr:unnamed protein product [Allacma fusca]